MITIEKINKPALPVTLRIKKRTGTGNIAAQLKENRITRGRRIIKRLQIITTTIMLIRMVLLFSIAALAASGLLSIFFSCYDFFK